MNDKKTVAKSSAQLLMSPVSFIFSVDIEALKNKTNKM